MSNQNNNQVAQQQPSPVDRLKSILANSSVKEQFQNALQENSGLFVASLIDVFASDKFLQKSDPKTVVMEALKAATLRLPINKNLGFAYIVPYKGKATMQIGYKGYIQLAIRTGQYKRINADKVFEGELNGIDKLSGDVDLSGVATSDKVIGYFAHFETVNGFSKTLFWTTDQVISHAKKFSQSFNSKYTPWKTDFDAMAIKTVIKALFSKYGVMSVDMQEAFEKDSLAQETAINANQTAISFDEPPAEPGIIENDAFNHEANPVAAPVQQETNGIPEDQDPFADDRASMETMPQTGTDGPGF